MDPDAALAELRRLSREIDTSSEYLLKALAEEIAVVFDSLDGWLSNGGFLPKDWSNTTVDSR